MTPEEKTKIEVEIAYKIGYFYFNMNSGITNLIEQVKETTKDIDVLKITKIEFDGSNISITTQRPGLLIGRHGADIQALSEWLHKEFLFEKILLVEERILGNLYNFQYALGIE
jgi:ribosomal protein S3